MINRWSPYTECNISHKIATQSVNSYSCVLNEISSILFIIIVKASIKSGYAVVNHRLIINRIGAFILIS